MGSLENRLRKKWQDYSGKNATAAELNFYEVFEKFFEGSELAIIRKPNKFANLYTNVELDKDELNQIYVPDKKITRHGIYPDAIIKNTSNGKEIYVEVKRQDGWVEGKERKDGRGNAHERASKYFTPGLHTFLSQESGLSQKYFPVWFIFQGDITRDICRVRELRFWFNGYESNIFFWRNTKSHVEILDHFINHILPMLS